MGDKPPGKGKGAWLNAGVQAQQSSDIEGLKAAFALHIQDHEDLEADMESDQAEADAEAEDTPTEGA